MMRRYARVVGMAVVAFGYWVPADSPDSEHTLVSMLAHESRLVSNVVSVFLNPTDFSPTR